MRIFPAKQTDELWNEAQAEGANEANFDLAAARLVEIVQRLETVFDDRKGALDIAEEDLAVFGQADRTAAMLEQRNADIGFQGGNGAAQCRLADTQMLGRLGDMLKLPDRPEIVQLRQFDPSCHYHVQLCIKGM